MWSPQTRSIIDTAKYLYRRCMTRRRGTHQLATSITALSAYTASSPGASSVAKGASLEDLRLAEEAGMVFPEAAVEEVEAEVDELEALNTVQLREKCNELGVVPVGDGRRLEVLRQGLRAARGAV
jgi:hypothetical protein